MSATIEYVYCVVPGAAAGDGVSPPAGLDRAPVRAIVAGDLAALVSDVAGAEYTPDAIAARAGDAAWLTPRAIAHDAVVTWASDRGPVVPLPMWVLFTDADGVTRMLAERTDALESGLQRVDGAREYGVRVSADASALGVAAAALDPALAALEREAAGASPGQAYLLRRKLDEARKTARRDIAERIAREVHAALAPLARANVPRVATQAQPDPTVLLNAAYLVSDDALDAFRAALTAAVSRLGDMGVRFDFTGPWPPYNFVRADA